MPSREGIPPGAAYRLHERLHAGGRRFMAVAFCMASTEQEVRFRWAGCEKIVIVTKKTWDGWDPEPMERFPSRVWPKE